MTLQDTIHLRYYQPVNYNCLKKRYWLEQVERVEKTRKQIDERLSTTAGRVLPTESDLSIGTGRRMNMAVMFLDICRFSSRPSESQNEQEFILASLNLFFSEMIKIAEDYKGQVEKNTGDGLMAYFEDGGSDPPENGTHRAVACSLTMMAAGKHLINSVLINSRIPEIQFRICIDYGNVTVAKLGAPRRFNSIVAIGTSANIASKMLAHAGGGDILIGDAAKKQLPIDWQSRFTTLQTIDSGWNYRQSKLPYFFYRYTGRWAKLFD